jgi:hypothetical protein
MNFDARRAKLYDGDTRARNTADGTSFVVAGEDLETAMKSNGPGLDVQAACAH